MDIIKHGSIMFEGDEIQAVLVEDNGDQTVYTPVKRLCENLGLDDRSQRRRINDDDVLCDGGVILTLPVTRGDGVTQNQDVFCLRYDLIPLWLTTITARMVKLELRGKVSLYRKNAAKVLADVFLGDGYAINPDPNRVNTAKMQQTIDDIERMRVASQSNQQIIDVAKAAGVDPKAQLVLTKFLYSKAGIDLPIEVEVQKRFLTCEEIAKRVGVYSGSDKPHKQVISMILNQLPVAESDKMIVLETNGKWQGSTVKYAESAALMLDEYLKEHEYPDHFDFNNRSYHVRYTVESHR